MTNNFSVFTNQYSLSKTLRFELVPTEKTKKMLKENKIFETDKIIKQKYEAIKPYFDKLHRDFVKESLENAEISLLSDYLEVYKNWKNDRKNTEKNKKINDLEKKLREKIVSFFEGQAKKWSTDYFGLKNSDLKILDEKAVFESLLKARYGKEEDAFVKDKNDKFVLDNQGDKISIFDEWEGFTGYFTKFWETRKNFYKSDGTSTAIATRIVDQNLRRFCENLLLMKSLEAKIDFSEIEKKFGISFKEIFSLQFYNQCLLQEGIDFYNKILGGETLANGKKQQGINELINKYRQDHKGEKLPFLKSLDKQILSEKDRENFIDEIESGEKLLGVLKRFYKIADIKTKKFIQLFNDFTVNIDDYDLAKIYLSKEALNTIFHKWTAEREAFQSTLFYVLNQKDVKEYYNLRRKEKSDPQVKKEQGEYKFPNFVKLSHIKESLENINQDKLWKEQYYKGDVDDERIGFLSLTTQQNVWEQFLQIFQYEMNSLFEKEIFDKNTEKTIKIGYQISKRELENLVENFEINKNSKAIIKDFADSVLSIYQMAKYFALEKKRAWVGDDYELGEFYEHQDYGYKEHFYDGAYEEIIQVYNKLRNYLTKKPYSEEKWKLNFENGSDFLGGWDQNQEMKKYGVILRKDGKYFLCVFKKEFRNEIFRKEEINSWSSKIDEAYKLNSGGCYEKLEYKAIADASKDISLLLARASKDNLEIFQPSEDILRIKREGSFKKGVKFNKDNLHALIDYYKGVIPKYRNWQFYNFNFSNTSCYESIADFTNEIDRDGYRIWFEKVSEEYINQKNKNGELYLFQIKNKDWNEGSIGKKNLHTLYFEALFSAENSAKNFPFKLNGQAEIFYRPKTSEKKLEKKKDNNGKEVIDHKRYAEDKIFFHVPITVNRTKEQNSYFNVKINNFLANNRDINIIGVDRGEKHLAYYSVINQQQEILDRGSLNFVGKDKNKNLIDYHQKLELKAKNREQERKDWQEVEGIKNLKKGYISQVVRKIADLAIKYNAIIVFEDLNIRFKQIRGGIEKSVYQQLEKALIEKLNLLVNKGEVDPQKAGHLLHAYQLTAPFTTFKEMGKQTGILFYTQASYTSKIDPLTGWRPNLYLKYTKAESAKEDILKFSRIVFKNNWFEFTYDLKNFTKSDKANLPRKTEWTVCSFVERFRWNRKLKNGKGDYECYQNLTENIKALFEEFEINISRDILGQIEKLETKGNEKFFKKFLFYFRLICQIRNTQKDKEGDDNDFILSPVEPFFDSRKAESFGNNLPKNGDDNGAYNIARKGIIILDKISRYSELNNGCEKMKWSDLYVSHEDWDNFAQKNVNIN